MLGFRADGTLGPMSQESTILLLAILVMLSPFLGLPYSWLMVIVPLLGLAVAVLSVLLRMRQMAAPAESELVASSFNEAFDESSSVAA